MKRLMYMTLAVLLGAVVGYGIAGAGDRQWPSVEVLKVEGEPYVVFHAMQRESSGRYKPVVLCFAASDLEAAHALASRAVEEGR